MESALGASGVAMVTGLASREGVVLSFHPESGVPHPLLS